MKHIWIRVSSPANARGTPPVFMCRTCRARKRGTGVHQQFHGDKDRLWIASRRVPSCPYPW